VLSVLLAGAWEGGVTLHIYENLTQGSDEWHAARRGIVTASIVGKLVAIESPDATAVDCPACKAVVDAPCLSMAKRKTPVAIKTIHDQRAKAVAGLPATYAVADNDTSRAVIATLVAERIAGLTEDSPMTSDMWRGVESEPMARDAYDRHRAPVTEVGFMTEGKWGFTIGYSPDGLVGDDGLIEIKAPRAKTHVLTVLADEVPAYNMAQLQCGLLVSGRKWIDFIPYVGGLPLWSKRVYPDPAWHEAIVAAVANFETTAAEMVAAYNNATEGLPVTERPDLEIRI
jgi:hypothetical protein